MSDNKTPIQICIEALEKELKEYNSFLGISNLPTDRNFWSGKIKATERAIQTLKSHLALEEEANSYNQWKLISKNEYPTAYKRGHWDGLLSDTVLVMDDNGKFYVANFYEGQLDGCDFKDFYDANHDLEIRNVVQWQNIID